jgi:hypothetical protein
MLMNCRSRNTRRSLYGSGFSADFQSASRARFSCVLTVSLSPLAWWLSSEVGAVVVQAPGGPPKPLAPREDDGLEDSEEPSSEIEPCHNRKSKDKQVQNSNGKGPGGSASSAGS